MLTSGAIQGAERSCGECKLSRLFYYGTFFDEYTQRLYTKGLLHNRYTWELLLNVCKVSFVEGRHDNQ